MANLDDVIDRSFQDELNRFNRQKIKTGESGNVAKLFKDSQVNTADCNICYESSVACIQCYQCDFKYCQGCLTKVISEFNKCSACQANLKDNYSQLKEKNKKHTPTVKNNTEPKKRNISATSNYNDLLLSDYEIEQLAIIMGIENMNVESSNIRNGKNDSNARNTKNGGGNLMHSFKNIFNKSTKRATTNTNISQKSSNNSVQDEYCGYLDNDFDDDIEPCQFQTVNPTARYNFTVEHNADSNELIYTPNDDKLRVIIINYKLLDKCFQRTVFFSLADLTNKPENFITVWQTTAAMIYNLTCNYIHIAHTKNYRNQTFIYQKKDLINTINQMVSYS